MIPSESLDITVAPAEPCWDGELGSTWMEWLVGMRVPLVESEVEPVQYLIEASWDFRPVEFFYHGGTEPGGKRRVTPTFVFTVPGFHGVYVTGICHKRKALRTFLVDRLQLVSRT